MAAANAALPLPTQCGNANQQQRPDVIPELMCICMPVSMHDRHRKLSASTVQGMAKGASSLIACIPVGQHLLDEGDSDARPAALRLSRLAWGFTLAGDRGGQLCCQDAQDVGEERVAGAHCRLLTAQKQDK